MTNQSKLRCAKAHRDWVKETAWIRFKMAMSGLPGGSKSASVFLKEYATFTESTWKTYTRGFYDRWKAEQASLEQAARSQEKKRGIISFFFSSFFPFPTPFFSFLLIVAEVSNFLEEKLVPGTAHTHQWKDEQGNLISVIKTPTPTKPCGELGRTRVSSMNRCVMELTGVQGGGDSATRLKQLVECAPVKKAAVEALDIHLRFDPQAALKIRTQGNFTNKQLQLLRSIGVRLPDFYSLKEEEDKLLFPFEMMTANLEITKLKDDEPWNGKFGTVVEVFNQR
jgi:hypothetical protein